MASTFGESAETALQDAAEAAAARHQRAVEPRHLLLVLVRRKVGTVSRLLQILHVDRESLLRAVTESLPRSREGPPPEDPSKLPYTRRAEAVLEAAAREAEEAGRGQVSVTDLLLSLVSERGISRTLLEGSGVTERALRAELGREREELRPESQRTETEPGEDRGKAAPDEAPEPGERHGLATPTADHRPPTRQGPAVSPTGERRTAGETRVGEESRGAGRSPSTTPEEERPAHPRGPGEDALPHRRDRPQSPERKRVTPPDFLELDSSEPLPLYRQIADGIREAAATGRLEPGQRLLPVRTLAETMDLAPGTVARAYRELEREGVLETRGTRGTFLAARDRDAPPADERRTRLVELLRPAAVSAFHLGARKEEVRAALEEAMTGILTANQE